LLLQVQTRTVSSFVQPLRKKESGDGGRQKHKWDECSRVRPATYAPVTPLSTPCAIRPSFSSVQCVFPHFRSHSWSCNTWSLSRGRALSESKAAKQARK